MKRENREKKCSAGVRMRRTSIVSREDAESTAFAPVYFRTNPHENEHAHPPTKTPSCHYRNQTYPSFI